MLKVSFVTPRYGTEVLGGAEYAARMLAERLVSRFGWQVEALTSCALDSTTWADHYDSGTTELNGVSVHRFPVKGQRDVRFAETSAIVHRHPRLAAPVVESRWIDEQGPTAPGIIEAVRKSDADVLVFYPYLYYPTVRGLPEVAERAVLHPAAHDEASIRLPIFGKVFAEAAGLVFQTDGERRLVESLFPVAHRRQLTLGLGVDVADGDEMGFRKASGIGDRPYLLCLGRVDDGKGSSVLARYFAEYKKRRPGPLALAFAGKVIDEVPRHPDVFVTGGVSDAHKWGALHGAEVLVSPSAFEAFSLALIEGWTAGKPALVNGTCLATREHVERSGGGLWFDSYASFEATLDKLLQPDLARALGHLGKQYVDRRFDWGALIDRYGDFLLKTAALSKQRAS